MEIPEPLRLQIPGEGTRIAGVGQVTRWNAFVQEGKHAEAGMSLQLVEAPKEYLVATWRLSPSIPSRGSEDPLPFHERSRILQGGGQRKRCG